MKSVVTAPEVNRGSRLYLRKLSVCDAQDHYLEWLNDTDVQKFTRRRGRQSTFEDLKNFLRNAEAGNDYHLAVCILGSDKHIGNISLNSIDQLNRSAEVSIMMGDKTEWGKGYGAEAVQILTDFAFSQLKFNRLWAESPNPAFNALIQKCGWKKEGLRRKAFFTNNEFVDSECWSLLYDETLTK